jgi:transposase
MRVVHAVESGKTTREVGALFQVSSSFVSHVHQCWQQTGHVHPKQIGGYRRALLEPYEVMLKEQLSDNPSMTLKELLIWLESEQGLSISISAIDKYLRHKLGYRYKKPWSPVSESARMSLLRVSNGKLVAKHLRYLTAGVSG